MWIDPSITMRTQLGRQKEKTNWRQAARVDNVGVCSIRDTRHPFLSQAILDFCLLEHHRREERTLDRDWLSKRDRSDHVSCSSSFTTLSASNFISRLTSNVQQRKSEMLSQIRMASGRLFQPTGPKIQKYEIDLFFTTVVFLAELTGIHSL